MSINIDKFIEYFGLIDWTNRTRLIELRSKLIDHGCYLAESIMELPPEFRNMEEVEIQQRILNRIISVLNEIIGFGTNND